MSPDFPHRSQQHQITFANNLIPNTTLSSNVDHSHQSQPISSWPSSGKQDMYLEISNRPTDAAKHRTQYDLSPISKRAFDNFHSENNSKKHRSKISLTFTDTTSECQFIFLSPSDRGTNVSPTSSQQSSPFSNGSQRYRFGSQTEVNFITPPSSPAQLFDHSSHASEYNFRQQSASALPTSPKGARQASTSRRGRKPGRQPSVSREKSKSSGSGQDRGDPDKDSDAHDSGGGDRDKDRGVKLRQRTAIACNYCRRRKVSLYFSDNI